MRFITILLALCFALPAWAANTPWDEFAGGSSNPKTSVKPKERVFLDIPSGSGLDFSTTMYCNSPDGCTVWVDFQVGTAWPKANATLDAVLYHSPDNVANNVTAVPVVAGGVLTGALDATSWVIYEIPRGNYWVYWTVSAAASRVVMEGN